MAGTVTQLRTPEYYYRLMNMSQAQCRARRFHRFPDLDPTADMLPVGYRVRKHDARGRYFLEETCENGCGVVRLSINRWVKGRFVMEGRQVYSRPDDWIKVPAGILNAAMVKGFLYAGCRQLIEEAAKKESA
jgi:hypothetical protein